VSERDSNEGYRRIFFALEHDSDGYPPVGVETVWAKEESGTDRFVIDNIPFFATQATLGDVVGVASREGQVWYESTLEHSGNSLIRVLCHKGTDPAEVRQSLEHLGCATEWAAAYSLVAVSVPPNVRLAAVQDVLQRGEVEEKWGYEEPLLMR